MGCRRSKSRELDRFELKTWTPIRNDEVPWEEGLRRVAQTGASVTFPVTIRHAAREEYDRKRSIGTSSSGPDSAPEFARRVKEQLDAIEIALLAHAVAHRDIRKAVVQQFPSYRVLPGVENENRCRLCLP